MAILQNTARIRVFSFLGVSITSLSVTLSKNGGAFAAVHGTGLENITGNFYKVTLDSTDTNTVGDLAFKFSDTVLGIIAPNNSDVDEVVDGNLPGDVAGKVLGGGASSYAADGVIALVGDVTGDVLGSVQGDVDRVLGSVLGNVAGNVQGKVLGGGAGVISAVGVQADIANQPSWFLIPTPTVGIGIAGFSFLMTDSTTHLPAPGKTVTGTISKGGGAFGALTNAPDEISNGIYKVDLDGAGDMTDACIILRFTATGCDDTFATLILAQGNA